METLPPERDDFARTLDAVCVFVRRFVAMSDEQLSAVALWTFHSHAVDAASATPYLSITSAEKESGKTRLLEALEPLVARPWLTGRVTAAVLPRKIEAETPTLLLDESDAAFRGEKEYAEALRGVLNSGHRRSGKTTLCIGQGASMSYKNFSTFCPKAIAGIGELPDTVASRAIPIRLQRRAPGEHVDDFLTEDAEAEAEPLRLALEALASHYHEILKCSRPERLEGLRDRAFDCWRPLLVIADLADGDWPMRARRAAVALSGQARSGDESDSVRLLRDIRGIFERRGVERIPSTTLIENLHEIEESPWSEWYGKPISVRGLAKLLKRYEIEPKPFRFGEQTLRGYELGWFEDLWVRYLQPSAESATPQQNGDLQGFPPESTRNREDDVADSEQGANPHGYSDVADVADKSEVEGNGRPADVRLGDEDVRLGDEMFPVQVLAKAVQNGHIDHDEAEARYALHKFVTCEGHGEATKKGGR